MIDVIFKIITVILIALGTGIVSGIIALIIEILNDREKNK